VGETRFNMVSGRDGKGEKENAVAENGSCGLFGSVWNCDRSDMCLVFDEATWLGCCGVGCIMCEVSPKVSAEALGVGSKGTVGFDLGGEAFRARGDGGAIAG
jgi:hypothetical protein